MELIGIIFKEYEQNGKRVFSAEITCGTRDAVGVDWQSANFAIMEGCSIAGVSKGLRETADRIDAMPNDTAFARSTHAQSPATTRWGSRG